jgi:shikimate kinase
MNIILVGLRCSGKTTVARLLAGKLGRALVDLDELTTSELGASSVTEAWAMAGQSAFRKAEARALGRVLREDGQIIALGGGTPTAPGAEELLRSARARGDVVFYLRTDAETLRMRLAPAGETADRPPVQGPSAIEEVDALMAARDPLYAKLATFILDAQQTPLALADEIASRVRP